jgi:NAD(P)-dependent dehydrogenase (short-subunit alcohol dehydrogenase family)
MGSLSGKTAVISGAAGGMGQVACERFCSDGATVIGCDLDQTAGEALAKRLTDAGHTFEFFRVDVSKASDTEALAKHIETHHGGLDVLYNNAGVVLGKPVLETSEEEWDKVHNATLKGTFLMTRALAPLMKGRMGSIINVSSTGGMVGFEFMSAYCAAKGGVLMFTKACAMDLAPDIRVNAICPGVIDTPMPRSFVSELSDDEAKAVWENFENGHLPKRVGRPEEVVAMARMLASDEASFITGAAIPVDGGWTAK